MHIPPNREVALFSAALELDASQRGAYLEEVCGDDPALRVRLEALLRVHEEAINFLEIPAPAALDSQMGMAMEQYRSKQDREAAVTLAKGVEIAESKLSKLDGGDLGNGWLDWIIAQALLREAKALLDGRARATTAP